MMFGFGRREVEEPDFDETPATTNVVGLRKLPRPVGEIPNKPDDRPENYHSIAGRLGFSPRELTRAQLMEFFRKEKIRIYPHKKVAKYMQRLIEMRDDDLTWIWRPLRALDNLPKYDSEASFYWTIKCSSMEGTNLYDTSEEQYIAPYNRLIPERVLRNVEKIDKKFGPKVKIFVTDYAVKNPDPFIAVLITPVDVTIDLDADDEMIVFDVWDEPGFTG